MGKSFKYLLLLLTSLALVNCSDKTEKQQGNDDEPLFIELIASSNYVVVDAESSVDFALYANYQVEVADKSSFVIYQVTEAGDVALDGANFAVTEVGDYTFYATYQEAKSSRIVVKGIGELPTAATDAQPERFESFRKHALGLLATGTDCPNCYKLLRPVHEFLEEDTNNDLIMVEVHEYPLDIMKCEASYWMDKRMGRLGFPTLRFELSGKPEYYIETSASASKDDVRQIIEHVMSTPALTAISANSVIDGDMMYLRADVKLAAEGEYRIGAMIVEDGIYSPQVSATGEWMNTHNGVLCAAYPLSFSMCEPLSNTKYQKAKSNHIFYCEFDLASLTSVQVRENCRVVIFVYDNYGLVVDNVIQFPIGTQHPMTYTAN